MRTSIPHLTITLEAFLNYITPPSDANRIAVFGDEYSTNNHLPLATLVDGVEIVSVGSREVRIVANHSVSIGERPSLLNFMSRTAFNDKLAAGDSELVLCDAVYVLFPDSYDKEGLAITLRSAIALLSPASTACLITDDWQVVMGAFSVLGDLTHMRRLGVQIFPPEYLSALHLKRENSPTKMFLSRFSRTG